MEFIKKNLNIISISAVVIGVLIYLFSYHMYLHSNVSIFETNESNINNIIYRDDYNLDLSLEEKLWLKDNSVVRLGINRSFPPFGYITENYKYIGFSADYMRLIEYRLGLKFDIYKDVSWADTLKMAESGQLDMIAALVPTKDRQDFFEFSPSYIHKPTQIFGQTKASNNYSSLDRLKGKLVAIEQASYSADELLKNYPEIRLKFVKNTKEALKLVSLGKADAYVGNGATANFLIKEQGFYNLSSLARTQLQSDHSIGVVKPNTMLASVINKALLSISKDDTKMISGYWFGTSRKSFFSWETILLLSSIFVGVALFFGIWSFSLRKTKNELKVSERKLRAQSELDHLTRLGNRRKFYARLEKEVEESTEYEKAFTLLFLDLDMFKEVNDTLGHAIGDLLLIEASKRLSACVGDTGRVYRLGGDEFVMIIPGLSDRQNIEKIVDYIRSRLSYTFIIERNEINITTSIGVTCFPKDAQKGEQLVINGDQAMYHSKRRGRDCYSFFSLAMQQEAQYKTSLMKDLRVAVFEKQFTLNYQPIVNLSTNAITKAEALIRWNHGKRGYVSPAEFIPLAEEAGLINVIGEWTFKEAMNQTVKIHDQFNNNFQMTVNTSPIQYQRNGMKVSSWSRYLDDCGLTGENIVIEITEGVLMEMSDSVKNKLFKLRDLNIGVAIDDFGTGYSSLSYLKRFDIDYLKIDQSFVKNLTTGSDDDILIQSIIVMAHQLGIKVIAEGIETEEQKNILMQAGCDFGQGYYFSKPLTSSDFMQLLKNWHMISNHKSPQKQLPLEYLG